MISSSKSHKASTRRRLVDQFSGVALIRFGLTGGTAAAFIFFGLWMAAQLPMGPSSMLVDLFTSQAPATWAALQEGVIYAFLLGFSAGAIAYAIYDLLCWIERRFMQP